MVTLIRSMTFDCMDALVVARFWAAALGSDVDEDSTPDKAFVEAPGWGGPNLWFNRVPETKIAKKPRPLRPARGRDHRGRGPPSGRARRRRGALGR